MLRKRLVLKNIALQFYYSINLLNINYNTIYNLQYNHLTNSFKSLNTSKFLISADTLVKPLNLKYLKVIKRLNLKYTLITYSLEFDLFKVLNFLSYNSYRRSRFQYLISNKSIKHDLTFSDNDEFNKITDITYSKHFNINGIFIELTDLLKNEGLNDDYNLGDWNITMKNTLKVDDLIYLILFNIIKK